MDFQLIATAAIIAIARIADVSLGTLRMVFITKGAKKTALSLGLLEAAIWVIAVSKVTNRLDEPLLIIAFSVGFAIGNYVGLTIEQLLAYGHLMIRVFTRKGTDMTQLLRNKGWRVTTFRGEGKNGPVDMLLMKIKRKDQKRVFKAIRQEDPESYFIIDDVHSFEGPPPTTMPGRKRWIRFSMRK